MQDLRRHRDQHLASLDSCVEELAQRLLPLVEIAQIRVLGDRRK
jgi:hypothetical protein